METGRRTILKAVLWNLLGVAMMALTGYAMTGSVALGGSLALVNTAIGLVAYVLYERLWARIGWGRRPAAPALGRPGHG
ncbi:MAG: hypothetical protein CVT84_16670 [Alphaproteobacteria bacterium HGW-Alphaproteobacteria-6]|nr:MAG: hypothetical protein CVT84_16670 [Alphaproteobacteria bacterium HGW-Alphaproteobacteria-6]